MSKLIWIALAVVVVGYLVTTNIAEKAEKESIRIEAEKQENATKLAVAKMSKQVNAITDWDKKLSNGENYRFEPILTVELERLWLQQNPILFIGSINDIATHDESHYLLSVERSFSNNLTRMYGTQFLLSLTANKDQVDTFLNNHLGIFKNERFNNGVAVIAEITSIDTNYYFGEEGDWEEMKVGNGKLVDILFVGDTRF